MNIKDITNQEVAGIFKMIPSLFKSKVQKSKEYISEFLGLFIHRSNFYGIIDNFENATPLNKNNTQFNSPNNVKLLIEGIVILSKVPSNAGAGDIEYSGYGVLEVDGVVVYDGRGSDSSSLTVQKSFILDPTNGDTLVDAVPGGFSLQYVHLNIVTKGDPVGLGEYPDFFSIRWESDTFAIGGPGKSTYFTIKPQTTDVIHNFTGYWDVIKEQDGDNIEDSGQTAVASLSNGFSPWVNPTQGDYTFPSGWEFQLTFTSIRMTVSDGTKAIDLT